MTNARTDKPAYKGFLPIAAVAVAALLAFAPVNAHSEDAPKAVHALAMHGAPKYAEGFDHLDYTNPDAPKGGDIHLAAAGTFDNLNSFIIKGVAAPGIGMIYQTLLAKSDDEAFTEYGQIAKSIEMPEDRSWVVFNLRPEAKFSDGVALTADDVVFTFKTLMEKGHPFYRAYYSAVKDAVAESPTRVKFTFAMAGNRELPLILGEMPVLPKHFWEKRDFAATLQDFPIGSGSYTIASVDKGHRITYARVKNWWAENLGINKGQNNFDTIVYDTYRDETVLLQAFFAGGYDFRAENIAKSWATEYNQKPVQQGLIKKEEIKNSLPAGMQSFAYNTRRTVFADPKVRHALNYAFDFEWSNKQFAYGSYKRVHSYFENSELAASGLPQGNELAILEQFRGKIPDEVFTAEYKNPATNGSGSDIRANLTTAKQLLAEAGWVMGKDGQLSKDGQPFKFEILTNSEAFERWTSPFIANLKKLGITATLRNVDTAQYQNRMDSFDFDMTVNTFRQSLSPGNEQRDSWGSEKADVKGSSNIIGIKNPVVDALIEKIVTAKERQELLDYCHALDRVLLFNYYVIPQWYYDAYRVAYWDKFSRPAVSPKYGLGVPDTWWFDVAKAGAVAGKAETKKE
ncbi:MAG: extracellular solute-binding protein [Micavibrio sp.]|nr:extracellular solute-binding protein [Micavibrio sp.]